MNRGKAGSFKIHEKERNKTIRLRVRQCAQYVRRVCKGTRLMVWYMADLFHLHRYTGMEGIALLPTREDESSSTLTEATWDIVGYELFFSSFSLSSFFFDASSAFTLPPLIYFIIFLTIKFFFFFFFFLEIKVKCFNCSKLRWNSLYLLRKIKRTFD